MEESSTYQLIKSKGELEGRVKQQRETILEQGEDKFGPPDEAVREALNSITDRTRLQRMARALLHVGSWQDLLSTP